MNSEELRNKINALKEKRAKEDIELNSLMEETKKEMETMKEQGFHKKEDLERITDLDKNFHENFRKVFSE